MPGGGALSDLPVEVFFVVGVVSAWAIGVLSRGGLSSKVRTRMYLTGASIGALIGSAAGVLQKWLKTQNW